MVTRISRIAALGLAAWMFTPAFAASPSERSLSRQSPREVETQALYWEGHEALKAGDWDAAFAWFNELEQRQRQNDPASADAAIYWQAYALTHANRVADARQAVARLQREFPKSRWSDDAAVLTRAADRSPPQQVGPGDEQAEAAIEQSFAAPAEVAVPMLGQIVKGDYAPKTKRRALFVLSQIDDESSLSQLVAVAKGSDAQLSREAIQMLGVSGAATQLREIYSAARDENTRRNALHALGTAGGVDVLAEIAVSGATPELRREAIKSLGVAGGVDALVTIARGKADLEVRREAIESLGVAGATRHLVELHEQVQPAQLRRAVIDALRVSADSKTLLDLYEQARTLQEKQALMRINEELSNDDPEQK